MKKKTYFTVSLIYSQGKVSLAGINYLKLNWEEICKLSSNCYISCFSFSEYGKVGTKVLPHYLDSIVHPVFFGRLCQITGTISALKKRIFWKQSTDYALHKWTFVMLLQRKNRNIYIFLNGFVTFIYIYFFRGEGAVFWGWGAGSVDQ